MKKIFLLSLVLVTSLNALTEEERQDSIREANRQEQIRQENIRNANRQNEIRQDNYRQERQRDDDRRDRR